MFQKPSSSSVNNNNNTSHGQMFDLSTAKLNGMYSKGNDPCLDGPEKFRRTSKGHMHDNSSGSSTAVNNGATNNGVSATTATSSSMAVVILVPLREAAMVAVCAMAATVAAVVVTGPVHKVPRCLILQVDSAAATTAAARWPLQHNNTRTCSLGMRVGGFNLCLGSPGLGGMPNGLNIVQLA